MFEVAENWVQFLGVFVYVLRNILEPLFLDAVVCWKPATCSSGESVLCQSSAAVILVPPVYVMLLRNGYRV